MSGFLLDTNVISMLAPSRAEASAPFLQWLERMDGEGKIFLSVVTLHEIEKGIALLERKGGVAKAGILKAWLLGLVASYNDKILGVNAGVAALAGQLEAKAISEGQAPGMADATVAAIAKSNDLIVLTCNTKHFVALGVDVISPDEVSQQEKHEG